MKTKLVAILVLLTLLSSMLMIAVPIIPASASPAEGYCLTFDGDLDYVEIPDSESLDITGAITVEAWIKPYTVTATPDWRAVVYKLHTEGSDKGGYGFLVTEDQSEVAFFTESGGVCFAGWSLTLDEWNHVVGTYDDAGTIAIYINGELKDSGSFPDYWPWQTDRPLYIGGNPDRDGFAPYDFNGKIEEVRIYNRAITADEVAAHYNDGKGQYGQPETGLVAGYHFDEGTGTTTSDYSGEENHGTIVGATWQESTIALPAPPIADFYWTPDPGQECEPVTFTDASTPDGGEIVSWEWTFEGANITKAYDPVVTVHYDEWGYYDVSLNVTDSEGKWNSTTKTIYIKGYPHADFTWSPPAPEAGQVVTFTSTSTPDGGTLTSWDWNFGDTITGSGEIVTHTYADAGTYTVTLTVTDDEGKSDSISKPITIKAPPPPPVGGEATIIDKPIAPARNVIIALILVGAAAVAAAVILAKSRSKPKGTWHTWMR